MPRDVMTFEDQKADFLKKQAEKKLHKNKDLGNVEVNLDRLKDELRKKNPKKPRIEPPRVDARAVESMDEHKRGRKMLQELSKIKKRIEKVLELSRAAKQSKRVRKMELLKLRAAHFEAAIINKLREIEETFGFSSVDLYKYNKPFKQQYKHHQREKPRHEGTGKPHKLQLKAATPRTKMRTYPVGKRSKHKEKRYMESITEETESFDEDSDEPPVKRAKKDKKPRGEPPRKKRERDYELDSSEEEDFRRKKERRRKPKKEEIELWSSDSSFDETEDDFSEDFLDQKMANYLKQKYKTQQHEKVKEEQFIESQPQPKQDEKQKEYYKKQHEEEENLAKGNIQQTRENIPQNLGPIPPNLGPIPQNMGYYPQNLGYYPQNLGYYPQNLGHIPQNMTNVHSQMEPIQISVHPDETYAQPDPTYVEPSQVHITPSQAVSQYSQAYSQPSQPFKQPSQIFSQLSQVFSQPSQVLSQPSQVYGQPSKEEPKKEIKHEGVLHESTFTDHRDHKPKKSLTAFGKDFDSFKKSKRSYYEDDYDDDDDDDYAKKKSKKKKKMNFASDKSMKHYYYDDDDSDDDYHRKKSRKQTKGGKSSLSVLDFDGDEDDFRFKKRRKTRAFSATSIKSLKKRSLAPIESQIDIGKYRKPIEEIVKELLQKEQDKKKKKKDVDPYYSYGFAFFRPSAFQFLNDIKWVVLLFSLCNLILNLTNGLLASVLSTLEKRYSFTSSHTSLISSAYEMGQTPAVFFLMFLGGRMQRPVSIGVGMIIFSLGCCCFCLPQAINNPYDPYKMESSTVDNLCNPLKTNRTCLVLLDEANYAYLAIFLVGRICMGLGAAPITIMGLTYISDFSAGASTAVRLSVFNSMRILGPSLGLLLGSSNLGYFVDAFKTNKIDIESLGFSTSHEKWIGNWWIGFLIIGSISMIFSIPLFGYRNYLPMPQAQKNNINIIKKTLEMEYKKIPLVKNRLIWIACLYGSLDYFTFNGLMTFGPKLVERYLNLGPIAASVIFGFIVPSGAMGTLFSAVCNQVYKIRTANLMRLQVFLSVLSSFTLVMFFCYCPTNAFVGSNKLYPKQKCPFSLKAACNRNCKCDGVPFEPICTSRNVQYFSACHAGCSSTSLNNNTRYEKCSCFENPDDVGTKRFCVPNKCAISNLFALGLILMVNFLTFNFSANTSILFRLSSSDKSTHAISMNLFFAKIIGTIPSPLFMGWIVDLVCALRANQSCKTGQNKCVSVDMEAAAYSMFTLFFVAKALSVILMILMLIVFHNEEKLQLREQFIKM